MIAEVFKNKIFGYIDKQARLLKTSKLRKKYKRTGLGRIGQIHIMSL